MRAFPDPSISRSGARSRYHFSMIMRNGNGTLARDTLKEVLVKDQSAPALLLTRRLRRRGVQEKSQAWRLSPKSETI